MNGPDFSIVMPVYNEAEAVGQTVVDLLDVLKDEASFEVLLVNDGSSDDTWSVICDLAEQYPAVKGVGFTRNFGHQAALMAGLRHASGRAVITMDSDGEHPPNVVPRLLAAWRNGARVVQTIRQEAANLSFFKRRTSSLFYRLFSFLAGTQLQSGAADFRLLDRQVVENIVDHPAASGFLRGYVPWTGFDTEYISFEQGHRTAGVSKFTLGRMVGLARVGIIGFSIKPLRLSLVLGLLTCLFALANLVYTLVVRIAYPETVVPGWATVTGLLALIGGVQLLVIGILGEYIAIIFQLIRNQPHYIVGDKVGFDDSQ